LPIANNDANGGTVHGAWTGTEALKYTLVGAGIGFSIGAYFAVPEMIAAGEITKTTSQVVSAISYGTAGGFYGAEKYEREGKP
jgi:hypothetical protein